MITKSSSNSSLIDTLNHYLHHGDVLENEWILAKALGYRKPFQVHQWSIGKAKVPLEKLAALTDNIGMELHETLPLWIKQELESQDDPRLNDAANLMVSSQEFAIVSAARNCYGISSEMTAPP